MAAVGPFLSIINYSECKWIEFTNPKAQTGWIDKNSNIPEGWRKGRVILNKEKIDKFNKSLAERNRKEVIILNKITNTKETFRLDPIFFKVGNLLSYEKLLELHKSLGSWTNVCKFLKMGHKSIKKIKDFYISLGYLF